MKHSTFHATSFFIQMRSSDGNDSRVNLNLKPALPSPRLRVIPSFRPCQTLTLDTRDLHEQAHVVDGTLTTFGCVKWESEQFLGVIRARCYPFKMSKRRFHGMNPPVYIVICTIIIMIIYIYLQVHTTGSKYQFVLVCTSMYQCTRVNIHTSTY